MGLPGTLPLLKSEELSDLCCWRMVKGAERAPEIDAGVRLTTLRAVAGQGPVCTPFDHQLKHWPMSWIQALLCGVLILVAIVGHLSVYAVKFRLIERRFSKVYTIMTRKL